MAPRSAIRGAAWRFAVIAAVLFLALRPAHAYIYHLPNRVLGEHPDATGDDTSADVQLAALPLSEGPMFSLADAPFGSDLPFIELTGTAMLKTGRDREPTTVVNVIFFNEFNQDRVGYFVPGTTGANTLASRDLCCTNRMASENICSHAGHLVVAGVNANISAASFDDGDATPPVLTAYLLGADSPLEFQNKHIVKRSGEQTAMVVVCSTAFTITEEVELDLVAEFRNPYGYVPGIKYGYIIGYGILSASYLLLLLMYGGLCLWHRDKLIPLQLGVAMVMLLGLVEVCTWFFTYTSKNTSGIPVCDADGSCPPLTSDIMAAAVLSVGKGTVSRALLLVVCLGYGVVRPKLRRGVVGLVVFLSVGYFVFGTVLAMVQANSPSDLSTSLWSVPVMVFDFVFMCWIYQALETIRQELRAANQPAKLQMYDRLATTLVSFIAVWVMFALVVAAMAFGIIPLPWRIAWALQMFWDIIYVALLVCITVIWAPGERTQLYALYSQPGQAEDFGGSSDGGDVELTGPAFRIDSSDEEHAAPVTLEEGGALDAMLSTGRGDGSNNDTSGADNAVTSVDVVTVSDAPAAASSPHSGNAVTHDDAGSGGDDGDALSSGGDIHIGIASDGDSGSGASDNERDDVGILSASRAPA